MARHETNPHFFRVILPQVIQNGTLELPRNFVKEQGKHLSTYARLRVPTGSESKVELKRCNGRAWLGNGWSDFAGKYSIKCGFFLVFKYEGGSRFSIRIFDLSTLEIEYPVSTARSTDKGPRECKVKEEEYSHDDDDEISDGSEVKLQTTGSFRIYMTRFYVSPKARVHIPNAHFRRYIKGNQHGGNIIILHGSDGKTWPVKYSFSSTISSIQRKASFTHGWKEFATDNRLRVGDICNFEMIICKPKAYKVTISRTTS